MREMVQQSKLAARTHGMVSPCAAAMEPHHSTYASSVVSSSFSTCTSMIGPPSSAKRCSERRNETVEWMNSPASTLHAGLLVRDTRSGMVVSQYGRPPKLHSAHMNGPMRSVTKSPASLHANKNAVRFVLPAMPMLGALRCRCT